MKSIYEFATSSVALFFSCPSPGGKSRAACVDNFLSLFLETCVLSSRAILMYRGAVKRNIPSSRSNRTTLTNHRRWRGGDTKKKKDDDEEIAVVYECVDVQRVEEKKKTEKKRAREAYLLIILILIFLSLSPSLVVEIHILLLSVSLSVK